MKLIEFNWQPTHRQLWQFGLICLVALPALGWLWGASAVIVVSLGLIGTLLAIAGVVAPKAVRPVFLALMMVTTPIGMVIGEFAMLLVYFGVILPIGLVARMVQRDSLQLKIDRNRTSYWEAKKQPTNIKSYYRQS